MGLDNFRKELETLLNTHSKESVSDTPDFILATYLWNCLSAFDVAVKARDEWYGCKKKHIDWDLK